jgi:hypothetical protein
MKTNLEQEVGRLKVYAACFTLALAVIFLTGFQASEKTKFAEIDVERINLVEKDGRLVLVMANTDRMPDPIIGGRTFPRSGARTPGMLFYNGKGDENGGLTFGSTTNPDGTYRASAVLLFDQYNQDQTVGMTYSDTNGRRNAGLTVWDRPDKPIWEVVGPVFDTPEGPERTALVRKLQEAGDLGSVRLFVGKRPDKSAQLSLADPKGNVRLLISVDAAGNPRISFLDEKGKEVYSLPPQPKPEGN